MTSHLNYSFGNYITNMSCLIPCSTFCTGRKNNSVMELDTVGLMASKHMLLNMYIGYSMFLLFFFIFNCKLHDVIKLPWLMTSAQLVLSGD